MAHSRPKILTPQSVPVHVGGRSTDCGSEASVEVIDRYQLVARLGKGGMAEVFRAKLQSIGGFERDVALKVLLPSFAAEPEFVEMLLDEARIAGAIDHPNVLQVLDVGRKGDIFYLVMEYVDGVDLRTLAKRIPGGRIPLGMALYVVSELLRGLHAVHTAVDERGTPRRIVHRDISPGNVMIDRRGFVKLGDFGIAHASGRITRTRVGAVKGKSRYMAPEQLSATPIDHRADLYAVGVTLFEAIMGDFARQSSRPTIYGPMFTWPEHIPEGAMPPAVEAVLRRAITENPEHRYRDAQAFREDLELALHTWAPGYGPDTLAREIARLSSTGSPPAADNGGVDSTHRVEPKQAVSVRPVRWRGIPTSEHTALPTPRPTTSAVTPMKLASAAHATLRTPALAPDVAAFVDDGYLLEGERTANEADVLPPGMIYTLEEARLDRRQNRRLAVGLVVAALALVTVAIAALVAGSGNAAALPEVYASAPSASPSVRPAPYQVEPRSTPIATVGTVDVLGPRGASIRIGNTTYPAAPTRVELPPGDYLLRMRVGKKNHLVARELHVTAGRTTSIR